MLDWQTAILGSTVAAYFLQVMSKGFGLETCEGCSRIEEFLLQVLVERKERSCSWMTLQPSESICCELTAFTSREGSRWCVTSLPMSHEDRFGLHST